MIFISLIFTGTHNVLNVQLIDGTTVD